MTGSDDATVIETVVVAATDLVAALESSARGPETDAVLRATPPFSGRMRARLHAGPADPATDPPPVRIPPSDLVRPTCPDPPRPDGVADRLRAEDGTEYTLDRHRDRYRDALRQWRAAVPEHVVDSVAVPEAGEIDVAVLGDVDA